MKKAITIVFFVLCVFAAGNLYAVEVVDYRMTNDPENSMCGILLPPETKVFDAETDYAAYLYYILDDMNAGDSYQCKWYYEGQLQVDGDTYTVESDGGGCSYTYLVIKGTSMAYMTGNWYIDFYYNGSKLFSADFYLEGIPYPGACAATAVLGETDEDLETLRQFRDEVLSGTKSGRDFIAAYYKYSPAAVEIINNNPALRASLRKLIQGVMPVIKELL